MPKEYLVDILVKKISGLLTPTNNSDATNKDYVDTEISTHNHDLDYSDINHLHDGRYSLLNHVHPPFPINGQYHQVFIDPNRTKTLSTSIVNYYWSESQVSNNEWMEIGSSTTIGTGYVMPFDGTVVGMTIHCDNSGNSTKDMSLYVNNSNNGTVATVTGGADVSFVDMTLDMDFLQGDKIRIKAGAGGPIQDVVINILVRWRA